MKTTLFLLALLTLSSQAFLEVRLGNVKNYLMSSSTKAQYTSGFFSVIIQDGTWFLSPCAQHPSPFIVIPNQLCPLGTTAFIWRGDADRDGNRDDGSYWSISSVIEARTIAPFLADKVFLVAAPPTTFRRPAGNFTDQSIGIYYNVLTPIVREYPITAYSYVKEYGFNEEKKHQADFIPGTYTYTVPALVDPKRFLPIRTQIFAAPESTAHAVGNVGFSITGTRWSNGSMEMDPRIVTRVTWRGIDRTNTTFASDKVFFSMFEAFPTTGDMVEPPRILYPTPDLPYELDSPLQNALNIIPFAFKKGDRAVARLKWDRRLAGTPIAFDQSERTFEWRCRFVDSYEGHSFYELPVGTIESLRLPNADYDLDGVSNFVEFAFSQDDGDDLSTTAENLADDDRQPVMPAMQIDAVTGQAFMNIEKRLNVGSAVTYNAQYSTNGRTWTTITPRDRLFNIVENNQTNLRVRTKAAAPAVLFMRATAAAWK
jgi:hypothetical protein